jgi:thymidylate synthase ThyX
LKITIHQENNPEDNAAIQAWYSRSAEGLQGMLEKLGRQGSGKFMEQIFIQYGHGSVGDLGTTTVHFEGISMLAAKALQDTPLYNGQESSTRYIDWGDAYFRQSYTDLTSMDRRVDLSDKLRAFYLNNMDKVCHHVAETFPIQEGQSEASYLKAVQARGFDIMRGFLPAGACTNVAWSGTLRTFKERLELLMHHPLREVRCIAVDTYPELYKKYPHSFSDKYSAIAEVLDYDSIPEALREMEGDNKFEYLSNLEHFYYRTPLLHLDQKVPLHQQSSYMHIVNAENADWAVENSPYLEKGKRPRGCMLPRHMQNTCIQMAVVTDFGGFRDLQRHRGGYCSMPVLRAWSVNSWYLDSLPEEVRKEALELLEEVQEVWQQAAKVDIYEAQYVVPMCFNVFYDLNYSLQQMAYVAELRSGKTVHPTVRPIAQSMAAFLEELGISNHANMDEEDWTVRRGEQDIVLKTDRAHD